MNVMFVIDGKLITPPLTDTILDGVNRDAVLTLAREQGIPVEESAIAYSELEAAFSKTRKSKRLASGLQRYSHLSARLIFWVKAIFQ
jgi:branched-chain amino acid aminotransferase